MFPDDRFRNLGNPTGSPGLAVNWSVGKNLKALVFKDLNLGFKTLLRCACILAGVVQNKGLSKVSHHTLIVAADPQSSLPQRWDAKRNNVAV